MTEKNVVTLLPSATEIVYALGAEPVGVSHECVYPPEAREKPRVNTCVVDPDGSSEDINEQLDSHDVIYEIDEETLREVDPDLVVTQGVCAVCAVDSVVVEEAVARMDIDPEILTTDPHSLDDVLDDVERIGTAIGHEAEAEELVADLHERIVDVEERALRAVAEEGRPRALVTDWMEPPMVAGHWVPEMVELAGGEYGITEPGGYSVPEDFGDIVDFDPETLLVSPCGFSLEHTLRDVDELREREGWDNLSAVQDDAVYAMDGDVINCPSPRLVDALETIGYLLHPDYFDGPTEPYERVPVRKPA
ncbi:cobalamin-binding protein [Halospeciosus flavus]|uniref:Cobalamin-binding protein n=1 Tax=Halospeciosus flavus TaxID=3032283 RepID=A0ABD5Z7V3_9EURY|nr:cobalamin-binding protein [Halospeciosus flavus]